MPWQDTRWDGRVCLDPMNNQSCVVLRAIAANRDDSAENHLRGQWIADLGENEKPACYKERGSFLSDREITLNVRLDYAEWSDAHKHIQRTAVRVPAYGATLVPFRWMLRENAYDIAKELGIEVSPEREPTSAFSRPDGLGPESRQPAALARRVCATVRREAISYILLRQTNAARRR